MITQVTYERLFNLGNYETLRLSATATTEEGDAGLAFGEARAAVDDWFATEQATRPAARSATYTEPPASPNQRGYIATLQDKCGWSSEDLLRYASDQGIDLASMTKGQASTFIDGLKKLAEKSATEGGIIKWAERVVTPGGRKEQLAAVGRDESEDLPF